MTVISYTVTPFIQEQLRGLDQFLRRILVTPLSPPAELKLRWQARYSQIYAILHLSGIPISKAELLDALTRMSKHPSASHITALALRSCLTTLDWQWRANPNPITPETIETLASLALPHKTREIGRLLRENNREIRTNLAYIASQKDHPVILSGIVYAELMATELGRRTNGLIPRLMAYLVLAKYGYTCRGLFAPEPLWLEHRELHEKALSSIGSYGHMTSWLEHYTKTTQDSFEQLHRIITETGTAPATDLQSKSWSLSDREQRILTRLEYPTAKITNRDVQQMFRISQVTASRELARLRSLGLLFSHGKGRSVYYTRL